MNGINFLADTNALIYLLNGNSCMNPYLQKTLAFSVISEMELFEQKMYGFNLTDEDPKNYFIKRAKERCI